MDESLSLRITGIFVTFVSSLIGIGIPLYYKKHQAHDQDTPLFGCMKACAAGVMLGIALCHLLPEAHEEMNEIYPAYPVAYAVTVGGVLLVVVLEQCALVYMSEIGNMQQDGMKEYTTVKRGSDSGVALSIVDDNEVVQHKEECGFVSCDCESEVRMDMDGGDPLSTHRRDDSCGGVVGSGEDVGGVHHLPLPLTARAAFQQDRNHGDIEELDQHHHGDCGTRGVGEGVGMNDPVDDNGEHISSIQLSSMNIQDHPHLHPNLNHQGHHGHGHGHGHGHSSQDMFRVLVQATRMRDVVAMYAMELSVAVHSIIIGADMGSLAGNDNVITLVSLTIAIGFHQFMEGFGLGTNLCAVMGGYTSSRGILGNLKLVLFVAIFVLTVPFGIIIGILSTTGTNTNEESDSSVMAKGCANSLAAGSLLYIAIAEMITIYFNDPVLVQQPRMKLAMLGSLCGGAGIMAVLAIWA